VSGVARVVPLEAATADGAGALLVVAGPGARAALAGMAAAERGRVAAVVPDVDAWVREVAAVGPLRAAMRRVRRAGVKGVTRALAVAVRMAPGLLRGDSGAAVAVLAELDAAALGRPRPRRLVLAAAVTDLAVATGDRRAVAAFLRAARRHGEAWLETRNLGHLLRRLAEWGIGVDGVVSPVNPKAVGMRPDLRTCLDELARAPVRLWARDVTAGGSVPLEEGTRFAAAAGAVAAVVDGDAGPGARSTVPTEGAAELGEPRPEARRRVGELALLTALAGALRGVGLSVQLWSDEIAALTHSFRKSFAAILTQPATFVSHPLYELLAHASIRAFGESPWAVRLPAAVFGTLTVPLVFLFARRVFGRAEALLAGGLLAVSMHHVFFSQDARGYTTMIFFLVAASLVLLELPGRGLRWVAPRYAPLAALAAWAIPFGVAVPVGQSAAAIAAAPGWRRRPRAPGPLGVLGLACLTGALVVALYGPLLAHTVRFAASAGGGAETGEGVGGAAVRELLAGLRSGLGGTAGVALLGLVLAVGAVACRRRPFALALLGAPVLVTTVTLQALRVTVHPRYLSIGLPLAVLVAARGLVVLANGAAGVARRVAGRDLRRLAPVALALVLLAASAPLPRYYRTPKMDLVGALRIVDRLAGPGDRVVATPLAGHVIRDAYRPGFPVVESLDDLLAVEASAGRVLVISTLDGIWSHHQPDLLARLQTRYRLVRVLPAIVEDGQMRIYAGPDGGGP
jgi:mannosyltransferase